MRNLIGLLTLSLVCCICAVANSQPQNPIAEQWRELYSKCPGDAACQLFQQYNEYKNTCKQNDTTTLASKAACWNEQEVYHHLVSIFALRSSLILSKDTSILLSKYLISFNSIAIAPSSAAKTLASWQDISSGNVFDDVRRSNRIASGQGGGLWTYFQQSGQVSLRLWPLLTEYDDVKYNFYDQWIHPCIRVRTISFAHSARIKRSLNGKFVPEQKVALRLAIVYSTTTGSVDKLERSNINSGLTAVAGAQHSALFIMDGMTNYNNEIAFSTPRQMGDYDFVTS